MVLISVFVWILSIWIVVLYVSLAINPVQLVLRLHHV